MMGVALAITYTHGVSAPKSSKTFTEIESPSTLVFSSAIPCDSTKMGECGTVLEYDTPWSMLNVEIRTEASDDEDYAQVHLCYAKPYIMDRSWRSANDVIEE